MPTLSCPSPNFTARRGGARPDMVILHYTAMHSTGAARARLCDPAAEVSAHYLIAPGGTVWALVGESQRAWHAGASGWGGVRDVNSRSIGIELANPGPVAGYPPFPEPQMSALEALLAGICARWAIRPERVLGHACIAPGRKIDPGEKFDWARLARRGLAIWLPPPVAIPKSRSVVPGGRLEQPAGQMRPPVAAPGTRSAIPEGTLEHRAGMAAGSPPGPGSRPQAPSPGTLPDAGRVRRAARRFGYCVPADGVWDDCLRAVWESYALRFLPMRPTAPPDAAGLAHLEALAARWPCMAEPS